MPLEKLKIIQKLSEPTADGDVDVTRIIAMVESADEEVLCIDLHDLLFRFYKFYQGLHVGLDQFANNLEKLHSDVKAQIEAG